MMPQENSDTKVKKFFYLLFQGCFDDQTDKKQNKMNILFYYFFHDLVSTLSYPVYVIGVRCTTRIVKLLPSGLTKTDSLRGLQGNFQGFALAKVRRLLWD